MDTRKKYRITHKNKRQILILSISFLVAVFAHLLILRLIGGLIKNTGSGEMVYNVVVTSMNHTDPNRFSDKWDNILKSGDIHFDKKEYKEALEYYSQARDMNPDNPLVYNKLGFLQYRLKNYRASLDNYEKAVELNPYSSRNYVNRGDAFLILKDKEKALQDFEKALQLNPREHAALYHKSAVMLMLKKSSYEEALENVDQAIKINNEENEKNEAYYFFRGQILLWLNRHDEAIETFEETLKITDDFDAAYANLGSVYAMKGEYSKALECYNKAISLYEKNIKYHDIREMNIFSEDINLPSLYLSRGTVYLDSGEYEKALKDCEKALSLDVKGNEVYISLAVALGETGQDEQSRIYAKKFLEKALDKDEDEYYLMASTAYYFLKEYEKALECINTEIKEQGKEEAYTLARRAEILFKMKRFKEAAEDVNKALKLNPGKHILRVLERLKSELSLFNSPVIVNNYEISIP